MRWALDLLAAIGVAVLVLSVLASAGAGFALDGAYWLAYHLGLDPPQDAGPRRPSARLARPE